MTKVFVGMSGGVDSSLSASLLVEQGYDVTGVYMKNWTEDLPGMTCPWAEDLADAKRVAVQLGIGLKVYDFQSEYREKVVDYMIGEYSAGRTPNPDIMCNQEVKFKLFLDSAIEDGAEFIATGHYARVVGRDGGKSTGDRGGSENPYSLAMAKDSLKDQTYFLYRITQDALARTIFPLGDMTKAEVRAMASARGLATANKKDSQGICFVGKVGIREFLSEYVETRPGEIVDYDSREVLGHHDGAIYYTIGQRHGLNIGGGLPYYVADKDMERNVVYVTRNLTDTRLWTDEITLRNIHMIGPEPAAQDHIRVRLRHRGVLIDATLDGNKLNLSEPQRALNAGQSAVIYREDICMGGGIIE